MNIKYKFILIINIFLLVIIFKLFIKINTISILCTSFDYILLTISLLMFILSSYYLIYTKLELEPCLASLTFFSINLLIFFSYLFGIIMLLIKGLPKEIHVLDLSYLSQYRYLTFTIITILIIIIFLLSYIFSFVNKMLIYIQNISFLKNEIVILIQQSVFIGLKIDQFCKKLLDFLIASQIFRVFFYFMHFLLNYVYRFVLLYFFIRFCFFNGDLRNIIYLLPVSFCVWLLSFFFYYFNYFINDSYVICSNLVTVTLKDNQPFVITKSNNLITDRNSLIFELTPLAYEENYNDLDFALIKSSWFKLTKINIFIIKYNNYIKPLNYILLFFYIVCWFHLCFTYFNINDLISLGFVDLFMLRGIFRGSRAALSPRAGYWLTCEKEKNKLRASTKGTYDPDHAIWADRDSDGKLRSRGHFTHDTKNQVPHAKVINPTTDLSGQARAQKGVAFDEPVEVDASKLKYISGSAEFCKKNKTTMDEIEAKAQAKASDDGSNI